MTIRRGDDVNILTTTMTIPQLPWWQPDSRPSCSDWIQRRVHKETNQRLQQIREPQSEDAFTKKPIKDQRPQRNKMNMSKQNYNSNLSHQPHLERTFPQCAKQTNYQPSAILNGWYEPLGPHLSSNLIETMRNWANKADANNKADAKSQVAFRANPSIQTDL